MCIDAYMSFTFFNTFVLTCDNPHIREVLVMQKGLLSREGNFWKVLLVHTSLPGLLH